MLRRHDAIEEIFVHDGDKELRGTLGVPQGPVGLVVIAAPSMDRQVAEALRARGLATLSIELDAAGDLATIANDLVTVTDWIVSHSTLSHLPLGYLGVDCFAAAAVVAAAKSPDPVRAIVALGGRIDVAGDSLPIVRAPTLLVCGRDDEALIERERDAIERMTTTTQLAIIPGAFSDPSVGDEVVQIAAEWLVDHFSLALGEPTSKRGAWGRQFRDRRSAGERLAALLLDRLRAPSGSASAGRDVLVFGLPRGGVIVADEIARILDAPLDVWLVRKIGMPFQPDLGMGALAEGAALILDPRSVRWSGATDDEVQQIVHRKSTEIRRRAARYRGAAPPTDVRGKTVILVDEGIATGGTLRAAIRGARRRGAARVIVAVPVAAAEAVATLEAEADDLVCIAMPKNLLSVSAWYQDFRQVPDQDVVAVLAAARSRRSRAA